MIHGFADKDSERLYYAQRVRRFPPEIHERARTKMLRLNRVKVLDDLRVTPSDQLERLRGDREGQYSLRINDQWRLCFRWSDGNAYDVEIVDYH